MILAKAEKRLLKQHRYEETRKTIENQPKYQPKKDDAEEEWEQASAAQLMQRKKVQSAWLVAMQMLNLSTYFKDTLDLNRYWQKKKMKNDEYGQKICHAFSSWYHRHHFKKYTLHFQKMLKTSQLAVKMRVRIFFKRRAIYKIRTFLTEFSRKKNVSVHVLVLTLLSYTSVIQFCHTILSLNRFPWYAKNSSTVRARSRESPETGC